MRAAPPAVLALLDGWEIDNGCDLRRGEVTLDALLRVRGSLPTPLQPGFVTLASLPKES